MKIPSNCRLFLLITIWHVLTACAQNNIARDTTSPESQWLQSIKDYQHSLAPDHPDNSKTLLAISPATKQQVQHLFGQYPKSKAIHKLARWMVDKQGQNIHYAVNANFTPQEAFDNKQANCLSFTLLLVSLASELDITLSYNEVDQPFSLDPNQENYIAFYRHINAIYKDAYRQQVFDLTIGRYNAGHPQRLITSHEAIAMLHANTGVDHLIAKDFDTAYHKLKLAVSLSPQDASLWINLGVLFKVDKQPQKAELLFLHALTLNRYNTIAASHLERLYSSQNQHELAKTYKKLARKARLINPYYHYQLANTHYKNNQLKQAKKAIKRAIKLHDKDAVFFERASTIEQSLHNYDIALGYLKRAYVIAHKDEDRYRYLSKIEAAVDKLAKQQRRNQTVFTQIR